MAEVGTFTAVRLNVVGSSTVANMSSLSLCAGFGYFAPHSRCAGLRIENVTDVGDLPGESYVRICINADESRLSESNTSQILFVHLCLHPHLREIGDCEQLILRIDDRAGCSFRFGHDSRERCCVDVVTRPATAASSTPRRRNLATSPAIVLSCARISSSVPCCSAVMLRSP